VACIDGHAVDLGTYSAPTAERAQGLRTGLPLGSVARDEGRAKSETDLLVRRLARHGLLEYRLGRSRRQDQVVIEPQLADYWPRVPPLGDTDTLVLSRFAYMRRRGNDMVLESPLAGALFKICDPDVAAMLAMLSAPQPIKRLRRQCGFPAMELLALLMDCRMAFKVAGRDRGLRLAAGKDDLVLWDFHDLLFHARSTHGRHANPVGAVYRYADTVPPLPAVRPRWPGRKVDLRKFPDAVSEASSPAARLLRQRHSTRLFDDQRPITIAELARFLDGAARVQSRWKSRVDVDEGARVVAYAARPYPSAGAAYELELYLAINNCGGLERGFYHYDAAVHALRAIGVPAHQLQAVLAEAAFAMGVSSPPQVLVILAARFGRLSWKYSSLAYALVLKDAGVMMQTLYLMATDMGLGGCGIGTANIDLFARLTGLEFHVEGPVCQFALGRSTNLVPSS
jgi:SagB-type dehydrogenase family enzyme